MPNKTTIKISQETKKRLDNLKEFEKESYEEIIKKVLYILNILRKSPTQGQETLEKISYNVKRKNIYEEEPGKEEN
jgi:hypothetical protein